MTAHFDFQMSKSEINRADYIGQNLPLQAVMVKDQETSNRCGYTCWKVDVPKLRYILKKGGRKLTYEMMELVCEQFEDRLARLR